MSSKTASSGEVLAAALADAGIAIPHLWVEPGRYIVGNAVTLLATVGPVKKDIGMTWVNVDASMNNLLQRELNAVHYDVIPASRMGEPFTQNTTVVGPLCTGGPLAVDVLLPQVRRDDILAFLDAGMYAETFSTQFNGRPRPATVLVNEGNVELIKERESVRDVFARHRIPERLRLPAAPESVPGSRGGAASLE